MWIENYKTKLLFILQAFILISFNIGYSNNEKTIYLNIDGKMHEISTRALHFYDLFNVSIMPNDAKSVYALEMNELIDSGETYYFSTKKNLEVIYNNEVHKVETDAYKVSDLLSKEFDVNMYSEAESIYIPNMTGDTILEEGMQVEVINVSKNIVTKEITNTVVEEVKTDQLTSGYKRVVQAGEPSIYNEIYQETIFDGKVVTTSYIGREYVQEGKKRIIEIGTGKSGYVAGNSVWDKLAQCESGGRWNLNSGNGYYGGLQFHPATWNKASAKVGLDIDYAHQATREQQIKAAEWLRQNSISGWKQWPACSSKLGLVN